jgi:hypothetical protein
MYLAINAAPKYPDSDYINDYIPVEIRKSLDERFDNKTGFEETAVGRFNQRFTMYDSVYYAE